MSPPFIVNMILWIAKISVLSKVKMYKLLRCIKCIKYFDRGGFTLDHVSLYPFTHSENILNVSLNLEHKIDVINWRLDIPPYSPTSSVTPCWAHVASWVVQLQTASSCTVIDSYRIDIPSYINYIMDSQIYSNNHIYFYSRFCSVFG